MTILALEFSSPQRSVAVLRTDGAAIAAEAVETGGQGTNAFGMIEQVLAEAKIEREQVEVIAVGLGPGSYTGIRAAISIAQGWELVRDIKLTGISGVECMVAQAQAEKLFGRVHTVIDAQRGEFYLATFEIAADGWRELAPLRILSRAEVQLEVERGGALIGPEITRWFPGGRLTYPRAAMLAQLASRRSDFVTGEKLEPVYLRETNFVKWPSPRPGAGRTA